MTLADAAPFLVSAGAVGAASLTQSIALWSLRSRLNQVYATPANDSFRQSHPGTELATTRDVIPDNLSGDLLVQSVTQSFDTAQSITAGVSLIASLVAVISLKNESDLDMIEIAALVGFLASLGWLTASLVLPQDLYATLFHPRQIGPLHASSGFSIPSFVLGLAFVILAIFAFLKPGGN